MSQPEPRAVVFDLDDTLYPYRRFKVSGFQAVADHLQQICGLDRRLGFAALLDAMKTSPGTEIDVCLERYDLPAALRPELVDLFRHHRPRLRLTPNVARTLSALRTSGWRLGILTNGQATIQSRKVAALGLEPFVQRVVFASLCGTGEGKPDPEAFAQVTGLLGVPAARAVFVGNDERCDVLGARLAGLSAIRCDVWLRQPDVTAAGAVLSRFGDLPVLASALLEEASTRHAA